MFQVLNPLQTIVSSQAYTYQINSPVDFAFSPLLEVMLSVSQQAPQFGGG
jgi:hypothetical protein